MEGKGPFVELLAPPQQAARNALAGMFNQTMAAGCKIRNRNSRARL
jgi:hypothetical protein